LNDRGPNRFELCTGWVEIILADRRGRERARALVDVADLFLARQHRWHLNGTGYVVSSRRLPGGGKEDIFLHKHLMGASEAEGDHRNRNPLDNRRENLRPTTSLQNSQNRGLYQSNASGYRGVSLDKSVGRWRAYFTVNKKRTWLGRFDTAEEAAEAALAGRLAAMTHSDGR